MTENQETQILIAQQLFQQIEEHDTQCAFWMVSIIERLSKAFPGMTLKELMNIATEQIPKTVYQVAKYRLKCGGFIFNDEEIIN